MPYLIVNYTLKIELYTNLKFVNVGNRFSQWARSPRPIYAVEYVLADEYELLHSKVMARVYRIVEILLSRKFVSNARPFLITVSDFTSRIRSNGTHSLRYSVVCI